MLLPWTCLALLASSLGLAAAQDAPEVKSIPLRTHSLQPPYLDSDMQSRWFDFGGDTVVRTDKYIRLTADKGSRSGWLFSRVPLTATNWEVEVEFKIHGSGNLYGDGMALWLTKQRAQQGPVFGSVDKFEGLGIFFDTYKNNRPGVVFPYVMAMLGDGQTSYDKNTDGKAQELAGCSARGLRNAAIPTKAKLTYFAEKSLKLELQYKSENDWIECFTVTDVKIPSVAYLGFSSETGELADNHDIISLSTKNLYQPSAAGVDGQPPKDRGRARAQKLSAQQRKKQKEGGSWTWFLFKFLLFGMVLAGAYVGFTAYRTQRMRSRF
ncbi:lectin family integral membrane protein [Diplodia corticola]|uniref:Lectin family integral membrane protein n=1 Tax=Diplodia corticola TaxID=236234 RepID=A0A1J9R7C4_9PEZI|nr:lectin family integral membrane protein [Diplodia corticola]OJD36106.1 lectin family integral membrane protein [Diplodia corticola]